MTTDLALADRLKVIDGLTLSDGALNVPDETLLANIAASIRRGHPQARPSPPQPDRILLVGGGPSLAETEAELVDLYFQGAKIVTVNGAYHWCLERHLRPSTQIVVDARPFNARFVNPPVPQCRYLLASQCAPETWDAVDGREHVWIWHALGEGDGAIRELLDAYYLQQWMSVPGGVTVIMRALVLLRQMGWLRFDLFGVDSCFFGEMGHAYRQPENDQDAKLIVTAKPTGSRAPGRSFVVSPWHLKQLEAFLQLIRFYGDRLLLHVHGTGLLAYALESFGELDIMDTQKE